jgi:hypothetical protein
VSLGWGRKWVGAKWLEWAAFCVGALVAGVATGWRQEVIFGQPDAASYLAMAEGRAAMAPFAWRQLGPLLVRLSHLPVRSGFVVEGVVALVVLVACVGWLLVEWEAPGYVLAAVACLPWWGLEFGSLAMPDLLHAALLSVFLVLLERGWWMAAAGMLFPMVLTRETSVLAMVCWLMVMRGRGGWRVQALAVGATAAGLAAVVWLARGALPNHEHLGGGMYLVAKVPWNLLKHVVGVAPWANVDTSCGLPVWQTAVSLGPLRAVGTCGWDGAGVWTTLLAGLPLFGLLPVLLLRLRGTRVADGAGMLRFVWLYGGISLVLAPLLGDSARRLFGYGWPLLVVGVPLLLRARGGRWRSGWGAGAFVGVHAVVCWVGTGRVLFPVILGVVGPRMWAAVGPWVAGVLWLSPRWTLVAVVAGYGVGWGLLAVGFEDDLGVRAEGLEGGGNADPA